MRKPSLAILARVMQRHLDLQPFRCVCGIHETEVGGVLVRAWLFGLHLVERLIWPNLCRRRRWVDGRLLGSPIAECRSDESLLTFKLSVVGVVKLHLGLRSLALLLPWAIYSTEPTDAIRLIPCVVEWIQVPCGTNERYAGVPWTSNMQECRVDIGGPFPTLCKTRALILTL